MQKIKTHYRRNLPHIQPIGATFFVTFRLKDSIPAAMLSQLRQEYEEKKAQLKKEPPELYGLLVHDARKRYFARYDALLDDIQHGPDYLRQPAIAGLVREELHRFDGELYNLLAYCIMPNHVHILIDTSLQIPASFESTDLESLNYKPLDVIMKRIKGPSAVAANRLLGREGKFWQRESYDHFVRNERELGNIIRYILENPVKAGWVGHWEDWAFSYCKPS
jgi:putative transposase